MSFNPKKCEFICITNRKNPLIYNYHLDSSPIKEVPYSKYLGVIIDNKLSWNPHIQHITTKATQVNAFLYRNLQQCPTSVKSTCYKSMVRPIVEYASSVWDPHTSLNIQKVESIQRRAARFCFNNFSRHCSVTSLLTSLGLPSYFIPIHPNLKRGYYGQLSTRIDSYKFSFFPSSIKLWNFLPSFVINSMNIDQFCNNLNICAL